MKYLLIINHKEFKDYILFDGDSLVQFKGTLTE